MKRRLSVYQLCTLLSLLTLFSGCRHKNWVESIFSQGCKRDSYQQLAYDYLRPLHIYNQFTTMGHFDVLWLANPVRTAYSKIYGRRHCYCADRYKVFLRRQLEENNHYITFYVLGDIPHTRGALLNEDESPWSVCLKIDGTVVLPHEIKTVELKPEYQHLFGKAYRHFKVPYQITFEAHDIEGRRLIHNGSQNMKLYFNTINRAACVEWDLSLGDALAQEDIRHPFLAYDLFKDW